MCELVRTEQDVHGRGLQGGRHCVRVSERGAGAVERHLPGLCVALLPSLELPTSNEFAVERRSSESTGTQRQKKDSAGASD